ncbi:uncharacterized protein LOC122246586 [Penaeus japonicus]|uniref:uncharacterized protein LOC122246586 n=1 Tax=Penaeus japonicus TaxID=27405 RepID=UPI001C710FC9|nr:uncharacterized protein LOC122246586 [Penaeus japonicus]
MIVPCLTQCTIEYSSPSWSCPSWSPSPSPVASAEVGVVVDTEVDLVVDTEVDLAVVDSEGLEAMAAEDSEVDMEVSVEDLAAVMVDLEVDMEDSEAVMEDSEVALEDVMESKLFDDLPPQWIVYKRMSSLFHIKILIQQ